LPTMSESIAFFVTVSGSTEPRKGDSRCETAISVLRLQQCLQRNNPQVARSLFDRSQLASGSALSINLKEDIGLIRTAIEMSVSSSTRSYTSLDQVSHLTFDPGAATSLPVGQTAPSTTVGP
jgi:hypothetical protein